MEKTVKRVIPFLLSTSLFAGPPMHSNDPFVPSLHEFEVNIAVEGEHREHRLFRAPIIDLNYGIAESVQLTLETAYAHTDKEAYNQSDFDSFEVAVKWLFYEDDFFAIALYPKYESYPAESIFNEGKAYELTIPLNLTLSESLDLVIDFTYVHPLENEEHTEFGTYLKYKDEKQTYFTELFMEEAEHQEHFFALVGIGYMYQFHKSVAFMISFSKEITSSKIRANRGYSGLQFLF